MIYWHKEGLSQICIPNNSTEHLKIINYKYTMSISAESTDGFDVELPKVGKSPMIIPEKRTPPWNQEYMTCDPTVVHAHTPEKNDPNRGVVDYMLEETSPKRAPDMQENPTYESIDPLLPPVNITHQKVSNLFCAPRSHPGSEPQGGEDNYYTAI